MTFDDYIGIPFSQANCAQLAARVLRERFFYHRAADYVEAMASRDSDEILALHAQVCRPVQTPHHGAGVVLRTFAKLNHIGLYLIINGTGYILHTTRRQGSLLERADRIYHYRIEGYYQWLD